MANLHLPNSRASARHSSVARLLCLTVLLGGALNCASADPLDRDADFAFDNEAKQLFESLKQEAAFRVLNASGKVMLSSAPGVAFWPDSGAECTAWPTRPRCVWNCLRRPWPSIGWATVARYSHC